MTAPAQIEIQGECDPRFAAVREAFAVNFAEHAEVGAAVAVTVDGEPVRLRQREFDLLEAFLRHPKVALDRERLLSMVWGEDFYGDSRTIDVHVAWLREKMKAGRPRIETGWGVGYKLVPGDVA